MMMKKQFHSSMFFTFMVLISLFMYQIEKNNRMIINFSTSSTMQFLTSVSAMIDSVSLTFMVTVMLISLLVVYYTSDYMVKEKMFNKFTTTMMIFITSMMVMVTSSSLFWIMVGWDGLGLSSFCLIMFFNNWSSMNSAMVTFMSNRLGDMFLITSIWVSMSSMSNINWSYITEFMPFSYILICIAAFSKSAQIPFSCWLPLAMAAPTPVSSLVHSSTLITAGVFILIRFYNIIQVNTLVFLISGMTMLMASLNALWEYDLKKVIALSTLSHVSLMMMFIYCGNTEGALMHMVMHACFKSTLFMLAGTIIHLNNDNQDIRVIFLPIKHSKTWTMFLICNMSMMGIPFLSGFYSKEMMMMSIPDLNNKLTFYIISTISLMVTMMYSIRIMAYMTKFSFSNNMMTEENSMSKMIKATSAGTILSVSMGGSLTWIMNYNQFMLNLSMFAMNLKLLILFVMAMGSYLSFLIMNTKPKNHYYTMYMANMMYLNSLTMLMQNYTFSTSFKLFNTLDTKGWVDNFTKECESMMKSYKVKMMNSSLHNHFIKLSFTIMLIIALESLMI